MSRNRLMADLRTATRLATRELRSGLQGFYIFLACLALGVGAIAAIGSLSQSIYAGLNEEGQVILGGDAELRLVHRQIKPDEQAWLEKRARVVELATLRAMAISSTDKRTALVEVKAVDSDYPAFGTVQFETAITTDAAMAASGSEHGLAADGGLLARLGLKKGDRLRIGSAEFEIRAIIVKEPDRAAGGFFLGPRVLMSKQALAATELVQPGSLVHWHYKLKLPQPADSRDVDKFITDIKTAFPDAGWRIRSRANAAPGIQRFIDRLALFLTLVGLTALIVGGVGIGNAVNNFLDTKRRNIAMLKCLGAPGSVVFSTYLLQVLAMAAAGIAIGLVIGAGLPVVLGEALKSLLPVSLKMGLHGGPLLRAAAFGVLVTLVFAIWPLARARELPATALFRSELKPARALPRTPYIVATGVSIAALAALAVAAFPERNITLYYAIGLIASFVVLWVMAKAITTMARRMPRPQGVSARLALANLHRPGAPTTSIVVSLGLGLTLFVTLALLDANLTRELRQTLPGKAPAFFFADIQPKTLVKFQQMVNRSKSVERIDTVAMLRGHITTVKGIPASEVKPHADAAWALRGDRGVTYSSTLPAGSTIVSGKWWKDDYKGPPLVSMTDDIAIGLGLAVGDEIGVNILGRAIVAKVASTRAVEWRSLGINFVMVFSPNTLQAAPHTYLVTVVMDPSGEDALIGEVARNFPTVTAVRVKEALEAVNDLLGKLLFAVRGANLITLLVGILVLAGAMATGLRARIFDAVILKTLGATRRQLLGAFLLEYGLLGALTCAFALFAGTLASWVVITLIMDFTWGFAPAATLATLAGATIITVFAGLATTWRALTAKVSPVLRTG
jgi:putative ABC transport system permease protein